jgi:hypothetical protein
MEISKLTDNQLSQQIDLFKERIETIQDMVLGTEFDEARFDIQLQLKRYELTLQLLQEESRNRRTANEKDRIEQELDKNREELLEHLLEVLSLNLRKCINVKDFEIQEFKLGWFGFGHMLIAFKMGASFHLSIADDFPFLRIFQRKCPADQQHIEHFLEEFVSMQINQDIAQEVMLSFRQAIQKRDLFLASKRG